MMFKAVFPAVPSDLYICREGNKNRWFLSTLRWWWRGTHTHRFVLHPSTQWGWSTNHWGEL